MQGLTPKQERFCLAYLETGNASEAYRRCYDASRMKDASVNRLAKALLDNVKIGSRLADLKGQVAKEMSAARTYELQDAMADCDRLQKVLDEDPHRHAKTYVGLVRLKAELNGLMVEARKNERSPVRDMGADEVQSALAALAAIRKAKAKAVA